MINVWRAVLWSSHAGSCCRNQQAVCLCVSVQSDPSIFSRMNVGGMCLSGVTQDTAVKTLFTNAV